MVDQGTSAFGLILVFLALKMATKFLGILPLTRLYEFDSREGMYTTLLMSTGLTFGTISALFGLTNNIIDRQQYTILVAAIIGSAVVMPKPPRTSGGQRRYGEDLLHRLLFIRHARDLGFEIDDIRSLLDLSGSPDRPCASVDAIAACAKGRIAQCKVVDALARHSD